MDIRQFNNRFKEGDTIKLIGDDSLITILTINKQSFVGVNSEGVEKIISIENGAFDLTLQQIEFDKYEKRKLDFENLATNLMISLKSKKELPIDSPDYITSEQLFEIESAFEKVEVAGLKGRWKTALNELNKVNVTVAVTQELKDSIRIVIENYINGSY